MLGGLDVEGHIYYHLLISYLKESFESALIDQGIGRFHTSQLMLDPRACVP